MTVTQAFDELLRRLELDSTRVQLGTTHYNAVKAQIEGALPGKHVAQVGSFQRRTKIRPLIPKDPIDIDAIVSFGPFTKYAIDGNGTTPQRALEFVRGALVEDGTYRIMQPKTDAPTVWLEYADGFEVELVPCFEDQTGVRPRPQGPPCYVVGTSSGQWVPADYDFDAQVISTINQAGPAKGSLVPFIKVAKAFFRAHNIPLKSFHTEILCALILPGLITQYQTQGAAWTFAPLLAGFLKLAAPRVGQKVALPMSYSPPVDSGLAPMAAAATLITIDRLGDHALQLLPLGDQAIVSGQWQRFFGEPFPS